MKHLYALSAAVVCAIAVSAQVPQPLPHTDYDGTSFVAHWYGADHARLTVFSNDADLGGSQSQDFSSVITEGTIDREAAAALAPQWEINVSATGSDAVSTINGKECILLSTDGDYISALSRDGFITSFTVRASFTAAETVTQDNSSFIVLDILLNDGSLYGMRISTYSMLFTQTDEYDFGSALNQYFTNICGIRFKLSKEEDNNVGDLIIRSIEYDYTGRDYLINGHEVNGDSFTVEGCDPGLAYFYYLSPAEGDAQSEIMTVDDFLPAHPLSAVALSSTSYRAVWSTPYKAEICQVNNYLIREYPEGGTINVLNDDFDAADQGTAEVPFPVESLDDYTGAAGWITATGAAQIAEGMIGTAKSSRPWPPMGGYIYTPVLDLSGNNGVYTISTRIIGTPGDKITVYRDQSVKPDYTLNSHVITIGNDGSVEATWTMSDGVAERGLHFESKGMEAFFIDYLHVTQEVPAGYIAYFAAGEQLLPASETECVFDGLEEDGIYAFNVRSIGKDLSGQERISETSAYMDVDLSASVIDAPETEATAIVTTGSGMINVAAVTTDITAAIFTLDGVRIASANIHAGSVFSFPVTAGTPVIVRAGTTVTKLIVR